MPTPTTKAKQRAASRRVSQNKSPNQQLTNQVMNCPVYRPIYKFTRTIDQTYNIFCDGINQSVGAYVFTLDQLPGYTDFTKLFDMYRITKVEIEWSPEYTELTDAALASNAVNVRFYSAVDISDSGSPSTYQDILEYGNMVSTPITQTHKQGWKPTFLMGGLVPCQCWLPTSAPSERHYGIKWGIPPTGVSMEFRAKVKLYVECANVN